MEEQDIHRVAAEAFVDIRTARKAYDGERVKTNVRVRLEQAAAKLALKLPPKEKVKAQKVKTDKAATAANKEK